MPLYMRFQRKTFFALTKKAIVDNIVKDQSILAEIYSIEPDKTNGILYWY